MKILYQGVDIYPDISVHRCYHDMYAEKQSDELLLKLNDTRQLWDTWNPKKGDTIAIEDGAAKTGKMFVESVVPESGIVTLRAYSMPQSVKDKRSKAWEKVKFLQLAQEIAGRHGLTLQTFGITDQTYDYVEQNNLPDFAFFQQRCTLEGAAFLVYYGKLVVYDEAYETYKAIALAAQAIANEAIEIARQAVQTANEAKQATIDLNKAVTQNTSKIQTLWDAVFSEITSNPFQITFVDLSGITLSSGIWNATLQRLEC